MAMERELILRCSCAACSPRNHMRLATGFSFLADQDIRPVRLPPLHQRMASMLGSASQILVNIHDDWLVQLMAAS
jgi:hypothetical protein